MGLLPDKKTTVKLVNPASLVLYGGSKQGKTTLVANLDDNLIIDLEGGTRYYSSLSIDVRGEAIKRSTTPWVVLREVINELKEYYSTNGKNKYKRITIDTAGELEDITMVYAVALYKAEARNKGFKGTDLKGVPNGAGWAYIREAFFKVLSMLQDLCETLIIVAHTKDKTIRKDGQEMTVLDIDVSGKMAELLAGKTDAIALVYRKGNKTIASFKADESLVAGARPAHIKETAITLCESDKEGNLTFHWDKVLVD